MKKISLEKELENILKESKSESPEVDDVLKVLKRGTQRYEYYPYLEEELRKRARNMFRKKSLSFKAPISQKILSVFSRHRGIINEIVKAVDKCSKYNHSYLTRLGVSSDDAETLYKYSGEIEYALSIMPAAYL